MCCDPLRRTLPQQRHLTALTEASPHSARNSGNLSRLHPCPLSPGSFVIWLFSPLNSARNTKRGSDWGSISSRCLRLGASPAGRTLPIARPAAATAVPLAGVPFAGFAFAATSSAPSYSKPASATQQKHDAQPQHHLQHLQRWSPVASIASPRVATFLAVIRHRAPLGRARTACDSRSPSPLCALRTALGSKNSPFHIANADYIPAAATALCATPTLDTLPYAHSGTLHIAARLRNTCCVPSTPLSASDPPTMLRRRGQRDSLSIPPRDPTFDMCCGSALFVLQHTYTECEDTPERLQPSRARVRT
ncbi:hypothetical protein C8F04DRAFT_1301159 [Mycena alexandri]|uniref:Uncharacterized protein n=1 Tax=Mycena alexandri TaxID=1745969 RepID=A0AAD6WTR3_9AGAR|nr:hypothetical protein C8F04DRAFT_1301159 [Mycena alexandri]